MIIPVLGRGRNRSDTAHLDGDVRGGARRYINGVSAAVSVFVFAAGMVIAAMIPNGPAQPITVIATMFLSAMAMFGIKVANQWEKAIVLRFGRFTSLRGPGLFFIIPIVDEISHLIDQRVRVTDVTAESALTRDTVPVDVDAIVFWTVWDAQKSALEVSDYFAAISLSAQTALRESIGRAELSAMITERERLGEELRRILDDKTNAWGITVHSVEIRDVKLPQGLEDAMSRQAQAERERQARIILGTAETEIAARFVEAGKEYENRPVALHLRAMNMLYEAIKEKGSMVIVPSSAVETMGLGGMSGLAALGGARVEPKSEV
jgi:regulator of protease activity HflC (stomatin/prohibitin superfamily)